MLEVSFNSCETFYIMNACFDTHFSAEPKKKSINRKVDFTHCTSHGEAIEKCVLILIKF